MFCGVRIFFLLERLYNRRKVYIGGLFLKEKATTAGIILVIDDDIISQTLLRSTLTHAGYSVIVASNGEDGIQMAEAQQPNLIVLDIMMPGMDGGEVAIALKNEPKTKNIPILFLSSLVTEKTKRTNHKKESIVYLPKPFNKDELLNEVKNYFSEVN